MTVVNSPGSPEERDEMLAAKLRAEEPYTTVVVKEGGNICAVFPMIHTAAIISGCHHYGYEDRWCYETVAQATDALAKWSGADGTEPEGWHRHPPSGRRRKNGDPATEYVAR